MPSAIQETRSESPDVGKQSRIGRLLTRIIDSPVGVIFSCDLSGKTPYLCEQASLKAKQRVATQAQAEYPAHFLSPMKFFVGYAERWAIRDLKSIGAVKMKNGHAVTDEE